MTKLEEGFGWSEVSVEVRSVHEEGVDLGKGWFLFWCLVPLAWR